jgi:general secretion pathway protein C
MASILKSSSALPQLDTFSGPRLLELGARHAPQIVAGLAVVGLAWQAAQLTWLFFAPEPVGSAAASAGAPSSQPVTNAATPQNIADAHLFGIAGASTGLTDPGNLPQSQSSLVLAGTMALDDPQAGYAIVGENAASAKFYRVGGIINGMARLHSVYPDRVIIDRNGSLETLVLPRGIASSAPMPAVRNVATTFNPVGENLRRLAASNPSALGELLRAQPVFSNGVQKGYRVYPGRDRQQFVRLGLQPGDLVTSVNGSALDDPNRSSEILNTLASSSTAQITVERNGTNQQLTLDMAQISIPDTSAAGAGAGAGSNSANSPASGSAADVPPNFLGGRSRSRGVPDGLPAGASAQ